MAITDSLKNIPTWGYAVGGVFIVGIVLLMTKSGGGGTSAQSTALPAADVNDILGQLQDAANQLGANKGAGTPATEKPRTDPIFNLQYYLFDINTSKGIHLYNSKGKLATTLKTNTNLHLSKGLFKIGGINYRKIIAKVNGKWLGYYVKDADVKKYLIPIYNQTQAPATTATTTATVPASNNAVT